MMIISLTLCALIFVQPTTVMLLFAQEDGQSSGLTQKSSNIENWTLAGFTMVSPHLANGMQEVTTKEAQATEGGIPGETTQQPPSSEGKSFMDVTQESPITEGRMNMGVTQELPITEGRMNMDITQESPITEGRMNMDITQESPATEGRMDMDVTQESPATEGRMNMDVTQESPITEGRMNMDITQESPITEGRMNMDITQLSPITEGRYMDVTQESLTTEGGMHDAVILGSTSQEDILRERPGHSSENYSFPDVTLTPYKWLCARLSSLSFSIQTHCSCDPLCVLYDDCCYGMTENTTTCAAYVALPITENTSRFATFPGTNLTEIQNNITTLTSFPDEASSWKRVVRKQVDPVSTSLAHKSSCRRSPALGRQNRQSSLPYKDKFGPSFWMVDQCPSSWMEEESRIRCTDISNTSLTEDALLYQPVTDPDTMITFRNKYCAACNGIKNGAEPWGFEVYCSKTPADNFVNCSSSNCVLWKMEESACNGIFMPKPERNLRTCFRQVEKEAFGPCKFNFINGRVHPVARARPLHSALRDACMAYSNPVVLSELVETYKNYHCMICYEGVTLLCEDQNAIQTPVRLSGLSFRALLYLGDQDKKQSDDVMTRPVDQQIVCPPGFVPDAQDCHPLMYNFTVVSSVVSLYFEPCGWVPTPREDCVDIIRDGRLVAVLRAVQARFLFCIQKRDAENAFITFVLGTMVTLHVRLADYEEGRKIFDQVQAWMENALQNAPLEISGGPVGIRSGSFSACVKNTTFHSSVPPLGGATTFSTPKQNRGNIHFGPVGLWMLMAMVAAV